MKKFLLAVLALCFSLTLVACNKNINDDDLKDVWGVSLELVEQTRDYLTINVCYDGTEVDGELGFGQAFTIEKQDPKTLEWNEVETEEGLLAFEDMAYILSEENNKVELTEVLEAFKMSNGHFRLAKEIMLYKEAGRYETATYYVEFDEKSYAEVNDEKENDTKDNENNETKIFGVEDDFDHNSYSYDCHITDNKDGSYLLSLSGNPTTGYQWYVYDQSSSFRGSVAYVDGDIEYLAASSEKGLVGGGGNFFVHINAQDPQEEFVKGEPKTTTVTLRYYRSWEGADNYIAECKVQFSLMSDGTLAYHIDK